jgi:hypothetical protein
MWLVGIEQHQVTFGAVTPGATAAERLHTSKRGAYRKRFVRVTIEHMRHKMRAEALNSLDRGRLRR